MRWLGEHSCGWVSEESQKQAVLLVLTATPMVSQVPPENSPMTSPILSVYLPLGFITLNAFFS